MRFKDFTSRATDGSGNGGFVGYGRVRRLAQGPVRVPAPGGGHALQDELRQRRPGRGPVELEDGTFERFAT